MANISRISRYFDGTLQQIKNPVTQSYDIAVFRVFPTSITATSFEYTWAFGDSLAGLASKYLGNPYYWWKILEINHSITDPFGIEPGTIIRIPYAAR